MRKYAFLISLLLFITSVLSVFSIPLVSAAENSWSTLSPLLVQSSADTIGVAVVDGKIYHFGWNANQKYDPETNMWTAITPPPIYDGDADVVACQNKIYVLGGNPTQVYDPDTDTWENRTSIPVTRGSVQANVVDGKIYVIGGQLLAPYGVINPSSSNDVYDPATDKWSKMKLVPTPVMGYASVVLDNKIYIIGGGSTEGEAYVPTNRVQIFNPETNEWTNGTSIPTGVCYARACTTSGLFAPKRIYVIGGTLGFHPRYGLDSATDLNQVYDSETDTWTTGISMPTRRGGLGVAVVDDEIYAIGGSNSIEWGHLVSANEKYTPNEYEVPEFPSWILLPLFVAVSVVVIIYRKKLTKK